MSHTHLHVIIVMLLLQGADKGKGGIYFTVVFNVIFSDVWSPNFQTYKLTSPRYASHTQITRNKVWSICAQPVNISLSFIGASTLTSLHSGTVTLLLTSAPKRSLYKHCCCLIFSGWTQTIMILTSIRNNKLVKVNTILRLMFKSWGKINDR